MSILNRISDEKLLYLDVLITENMGLRNYFGYGNLIALPALALFFALIHGCADPADCPLECSHGDLIYADCYCDCHTSWSGPACTECVIDCHQGTLNEEFCACECPPNWCGEYCEIEVIECMNGGQWDYSTCGCDCLDGFGGEDCTEFLGFGFDDDYIFFDMIHVVDGVESLVAQYIVVNNTNGVFQVVESMPPSIGSGSTSLFNFLIQFGVAELEENTSFTIGIDEDFSAILWDWQPPFEFEGAASSGQLEISSINPAFNAYFDFVLVDYQTHEDTLLISNGIAHFNWPE